MNILIVEDEELAVEKLLYTVSLLDVKTEVVGTTGSIKGTVDWLQRHAAPDIILMDIELSDGQSFEIFNQVEVPCNVIFTTSYDEFAIKAFKVNSIDYLLKPVQKEDLKKAFEKHQRLQGISRQHNNESMQIQSLVKELKSQIQPKEYRRRFLVKLGQKHLPVEVEDIAYFFVDDRAICFKTLDFKKYIIDYPMDEIEEMVDEHRFFRVNRSFIVSVESVKQMHDYFNSRMILTLQPEMNREVIVSREKVNDFKKWMGR